MAIKLYFVNLDAANVSDQELRAVLTATEQERRHRLSEPRRRRWSVGRALLRPLIGLSDTTTDFATTPNGKPFLENGPYFSVATSENLMLVGTSDTAPIGVDIELIRDVAFPDNWPIVYPSLAAMRRAEHPDDSRSVRFLRAWTRLEAVTKRDGERLGRALEPTAQPLYTSFDTGVVIDVDIDDNTVAALACREQDDVALSHIMTPDDIFRRR